MMERELKEIKNLLRALLLVVFVSFAVISATTIISVRTSTDAKTVGKQNTTFLGNFSDYMRCLVVNDPEVLERLGKEAYFNECDKLLFRNTKVEHEPTRVTFPPTTTTTSVP